jgi:hypothetical protein
MIHINLDGPHRPRRRYHNPETNPVADLLLGIILAVGTIIAFFLISLVVN